MYGPLHTRRIEIDEAMEKIPIRTGDIFVRVGSERFMGIPFSPWAARLSNSPYSHASVALVEPSGITLVEVSNADTLQLRLVDWLDLCHTSNIAVYRPIGVYPNAEAIVRRFLARDPVYNFLFTSKARSKFYCTESAVWIMEHFGVPASFDAKRLKDIMPWWAYGTFVVGNWLVWLLTAGKVHMPLNERLYFVGDKTRGMLSSPYLVQVYPHNTYGQLLLLAQEELRNNPLAVPGSPKPAPDA